MSILFRYLPIIFPLPCFSDVLNYDDLQWGTWKSGVSLVNTGIRHPGSVMKNVIPIVMAGGTISIISLEMIYGL